MDILLSINCNFLFKVMYYSNLVIHKGYTSLYSLTFSSVTNYFSSSKIRFSQENMSSFSTKVETLINSSKLEFWLNISLMYLITFRLKRYLYSFFTFYFSAKCDYFSDSLKGVLTKSKFFNFYISSMQLLFIPKVVKNRPSSTI